MSVCGTAWQPTEITRVIETFPTSTRVAKVMTDEGVGFLKSMGNPAGNESLASELVGSELAALLGLTVPPFAIVDVGALEIPFEGGGQADAGPAFISRELIGVTADGTDTFLRKLIRPLDVALMVVFDTWVRNLDRCPPADYFDPEPRRDNLFFTPVRQRFNLVALDHSHCFAEEGLEIGLGHDQFVEDTGIYGLFPEFEPYLTGKLVQQAVEALRAVDQADVHAIVASVPVPWGPGAGLRQLWCDKIMARRDVVADHISDKLVPQGELDLEE